MYVSYSQSSGIVRYYDGDSLSTIGHGSAGAPDHRNNPDSDHLRGKGPLPRGVYRMGIVPHPRFKAPAIRLDPLEGQTYGRSGFWIHGGTSSEGCILLQRPERVALASVIRRGCKVLVVLR